MSNPNTDAIDEDDLEAGERAEIIRINDKGEIAFVHPLLAAAVYESAPRGERRRVHEQLAEEATDAEVRARHLAASCTVPDDSVARALEVGAETARSRGSWESAGELYRNASELTPPDQPDAAWRRRIQAAEHFVHAGERQRARELLSEIVADDAPPSVRANALRVLAEIAFHDETYGESARLFEEAALHAEDSETKIAVELGLGYLATFSADYESACQHSWRAAELAEASGNDALLAEGLAFTVMYEFLSGRPADWPRLERALALEDPDRIVPIWLRPSVVDAFVRMFHGNHAEGRALLAALRARAIATGDESDLSFLQLWSSWLETRGGHLVAAKQLADDAVATARLAGSRSIGAWAEIQRAYVGAHLGEIVETRHASDLGLQRLDWVGGGMLILWIMATKALLEVSLGNYQAAWDACAMVAPVFEQQGISEPIPLFFLPDALEALIALEDLVTAGRLLEIFEGAARRTDRLWALTTGARCRALLLAARADLTGAIAATEQAFSFHEQIDLPFELGRVHLARGIIERRLRHRANAKEHFESAREIFEHIGTPLWVKRARDELARVGLRRTSGDELTEAERKVAALTAEGKTRRQVAAALFISPKTVDATLARVYRKLGVSSRAELGARAPQFVQE